MHCITYICVLQHDYNLCIVLLIISGVGWAMFVVSVLISVYYNMIIAYTLYYLFASFAKILPWSDCGEWSTEGKEYTC